jgi:hypothetical protein
MAFRDFFFGPKIAFRLQCSEVNSLLSRIATKKRDSDTAIKGLQQRELTIKVKLDPKTNRPMDGGYSNPNNIKPATDKREEDGFAVVDHEEKQDLPEARIGSNSDLTKISNLYEIALTQAPHAETSVTYYANDTHAVVNMARDTPPGQDTAAHVPYVKSIIEAIKIEREQALRENGKSIDVAIIPILQIQREHAVLLEVRFSPIEQMIVHDWRSSFHKMFYPNHLERIAAELDFAFEYNCYGTQLHSDLCGEYTVVGISSFLDRGDSRALSTLALSASDVKSKENFIAQNGNIPLSKPSVPLIAKAGAGLGVLAIGLGVVALINIWNPLGWGILVSAGLIAAGAGFISAAFAQQPSNYKIAGIGGLGAALTVLGGLTVGLGLLSNPVGWSILAGGLVGTLISGIRIGIKKWQDYRNNKTASTPISHSNNLVRDRLCANNKRTSFSPARRTPSSSLSTAAKDTSPATGLLTSSTTFIGGWGEGVEVNAGVSPPADNEHSSSIRRSNFRSSNSDSDS